MKLSKRKGRITIRQTLWILVLGIILLVLLKSLYGLYMRYRESGSDVQQAQAQMDALALREGNLQKSIAELSTERGKEQEIRTRFNAAKTGESLVVIVDDPAPTSTATTTSVGWWQAVKDWFLK